MGLHNYEQGWPSWLHFDNYDRDVDADDCFPQRVWGILVPSSYIRNFFQSHSTIRTLYNVPRSLINHESCEWSKLKSWLKMINCAALHINYNNCPSLVFWSQYKLCCLPISFLVSLFTTEINWSHCVHSAIFFLYSLTKLHWQHWVGFSFSHSLCSQPYSIISLQLALSSFPLSLFVSLGFFCIIILIL